MLYRQDGAGNVFCDLWFGGKESCMVDDLPGFIVLDWNLS